MRVKKQKAPKMLEKEIEGQIFEFLKWLGVLCWKNVTGGYFDTKRRIFRKQASPYAMNGTSDILGIIDQKFLAIEVKSKSGKPTEEQKRFINDVNVAGGIAFVARSIEEVALELAKHFPQAEHEKFRKFMDEYTQSRRTDH